MFNSTLIPWAPLGLKSEFRSAVSSAVLEVQRLLSFNQHSHEMDLMLRGRTLSSVAAATTQASAFDLQRFAKQRLATVRARGEVAPSLIALEAFDLVLRLLVQDNGPTPQVAATPSGSFEVQWLVDGTLVSVLFDETGGCSLLAVDEFNEVIMDAEVSQGTFPEELRLELSSVMASMSEKIVARPKSWSMRG